VEANGYTEGTPTPPDLKESFAVGAGTKTGVPDVDAYWFPDNVFPDEIVELRDSVTGCLARMRALADELLTVAATSLGQPDDFCTRHTGRSTYTMNINWYPPTTLAGPPAEGQFRIGPHTDFGTFTLVDREPGKGGLQVWSPDGDWENAPYYPEAFTINTGDLRPAGAETAGSPTGTGALAAGGCARRGPGVPGVLLRSGLGHHGPRPATPVGKRNSYPPTMASEFLRRLPDANHRRLTSCRWWTRSCRQ